MGRCGGSFPSGGSPPSLPRERGRSKGAATHLHTLERVLPEKRKSRSPGGRSAWHSAMEGYSLGSNEGSRFTRRPRICWDERGLRTLPDGVAFAFSKIVRDTETLRP